MEQTRLQAMCKAFGWQGGTVHQVNAEIKRLFDLKRETDINTMSDDLFYFLLGAIPNALDVVK